MPYGAADTVPAGNASLRASTLWRLGLVVARGLDRRSYSTLGPVSTGMGDRLRAGKSPRFVTSHSGQLSLLPSEGRDGTENEYQPKCGDALRLGIQVKAGMDHYFARGSGCEVL